MATDNEQYEFELFKLEYERASERYENIYKAIWQNFNYMAIISGGILAFFPKGEFYPLVLRAGLALIPLVVWFWGTYLPLDRYGHLARGRLGLIEEICNEEFIKEELVDGKPKPPYEYTDPRLGTIKGRKRIEHYQLFYGKEADAANEAKSGNEGIQKDLLPTFERDLRHAYSVRSFMRPFGYIVTALCAILFVIYFGIILVTLVAS